MLSLQFLAYFVMIPWRMMSPIRENNLKLNTKTITLKRKSFNTNITKHQTLHECIYKCIYFVYETLWLKCNILFTTNNFILTQITSYFLDTTRILNYNKDNDLNFCLVCAEKEWNWLRNFLKIKYSQQANPGKIPRTEASMDTDDTHDMDPN